MAYDNIIGTTAVTDAMVPDQTAKEIIKEAPGTSVILERARQVPLWDEIKPLLVEAIGQKVDQAAIFGTDKPESWPVGLVPGAIAAGNTVAAGTYSDFGADVAALAEKVSTAGIAVNGFASRPGLQWKLVGMRDANGQPIYTPALAAGNTVRPVRLPAGRSHQRRLEHRRSRAARR